MHLKAGLLSAFLWLTGCTAPGPTLDDPEQEQAQVREQVPLQKPAPEPEQAQENERVLTASRMLTALERIAGLATEHTQRRIAALQNGADDFTAEDRFELALLLSRKGANNGSLKQALKLLEELEAEADGPAVKEALRLHRHSLRREQLYRAERSKSSKLQKKIEYLKGLERELEESNKRVKDPLGLETEPAQ